MSENRRRETEQERGTIEIVPIAKLDDWAKAAELARLARLDEAEYEAALDHIAQFAGTGECCCELC